MKQGKVIASSELLWAAAISLLFVPVHAQMQMDPNMQMDSHMDHSHMQAAPAQQAARSQQKQPDASQPAMPFGKVADGMPDGPQQTIPPTPSPTRLDLTVQEQEHPQQRSGSIETPTPALLADVNERRAQPLGYFEGLALKNNPTLKQAEAQVRRLQAEAKQQGLWSNPEIGYEADHVRGGSYHSGEQGGYVQQTVPLAGQRSTARAAVEQQARQAQAVLAAQQTRVKAAVWQAFYAALAMQAEVDLRTQLAGIAADAAVTTHQLGNVGQADAPDILQSEVEREQAKLDLATAQREYRKAFATLAAVSGDNAIMATPLEGDLKAVPQLNEASAQSVAEASPTLNVAQQEVNANEAAVRSARRQQMPQLTLRAGVQQDNEPLESTNGRVGVVGVAQAGITLPLWNRNQGAVEAAKAGVLSSQAEVERTQLQLKLQAAQTMQDYSNATQQAQRYRDELLPRAARAYELYQQKYMTMAAAYPQVLVSQRTLFQLQIEYVHALGAAWQSAILLQNGLLQDGLQAPATITAASSTVMN